MLVELRPLPIKKWHGKKDGESFAQPKAVEALYDPKNGGYATGLTSEQATEYGKLLSADLSNTFNPLEPHPFWSSKAAWVYLPNHTKIFDTSKPREFVQVALLKASKRVANSMSEYEQNLWPDATHVIFDEAEEVALKATKIQNRNKAVVMLGKMSTQDKVNIVQVLSEKTVKNNSLDFIDVEIDDIINTKVDEFLALVNLGSAEVSIRSKVFEMISKNIITKEGGSYFYMGELIGMDYTSLIGYFKDPNNQKMKVIMMQRLEN